MMTLEIDHKSPMPLHIQVEALLRTLINSPMYQDGALLPKEIELSNRLGVSRNTIRQATNKLVLEGLLTRKKRVGSKASNNNKPTKGKAHWYSFTQEMNQKGLKVINRSLVVDRVAVDNKLAAFFKIDFGQKVLMRSKLMGTENHPIVYFESYFHPSLPVNEKDDVVIPFYDLLESKYGIVVGRSTEHIRAQIAGKYARKLNIAKADSVLFRERFVFDSKGLPIAYNIGCFSSDKYVYTLDIKKV
ncbi:GntR family transcriptional regulator [Arachidicoccus ginsenosidivorans]|jgi:GntR family transcriptional regulator|uniref:GntR family transcriptional regulator n=1 Tax=Arachidicoccus ginsenosidivorans TaxID=496057 RepID=A0A5B8VQ87_9BACT|nr:GntR family transcriptional regulator [Arachidicoccus ginsenosidivorans]QEC73797.1 GntR family transcriptional regulator [Arachidicoccus ginsenosidivorans]